MVFTLALLIMQNILLNFFYERNNTLKDSTGFSPSDDSKIVAKFNFKVSNFRTDEENTIETNSLAELKTAVAAYYKDTDSNFEDFLHIHELIREDEVMFVHLQLH